MTWNFKDKKHEWLEPGITLKSICGLDSSPMPRGRLSRGIVVPKFGFHLSAHLLMLFTPVTEGSTPTPTPLPFIWVMEKGFNVLGERINSKDNSAVVNYTYSLHVISHWVDSGIGSLLCFLIRSFLRFLGSNICAKPTTRLAFSANLTKSTWNLGNSPISRKQSPHFVLKISLFLITLHTLRKKAEQMQIWKMWQNNYSHSWGNTQERLGETSECLCVRKQSGTANFRTGSLSSLSCPLTSGSNGFSKSSANSTGSRWNK